MHDIMNVSSKPPPWAADATETHGPKKHEQGGYPLRSLVVDDDNVILKTVAQMLVSLGFRRVETAQRRPELVNKLSAGPYDLLLTDLEMPDMNGYHLTQKIKQEVRDTKAIIMTGRHKKECVEMMAAQWVDGWLFKPFGLKELRYMLQWLGLFKVKD
jgi:two-component system capsular synthesis sensor histidine kinase RcsC